MNSINIYGNTRTYLCKDTSKYAEIMRCKTSNDNVNYYNRSSCVFRLYQYASYKYICKEYFLITTKESGQNIVLLKDLTPDVVGLECVCTISGEDVSIFVKGSTPSVDIILQVIHSNNISFFEMQTYEEFTYDSLTNVIKATTDSIIPRQSNNTNLSSVLKSTGYDKGFNKVCEVSVPYGMVSMTLVVSESANSSTDASLSFVNINCRKDGNRLINSISQSSSVKSGGNHYNTPTFHIVNVNNEKAVVYLEHVKNYTTYLVSLLTYQCSNINDNKIAFDYENNILNVIDTNNSVSYKYREHNEITLKNNWNKSSNGITIEERVGERVDVYLNITGGSLGSNIEIAELKNLPKHNLYIPAVYFNDGKYYPCMLSVWQTGVVQLTNIPSNERVVANFSYNL